MTNTGWQNGLISQILQDQHEYATTVSEKKLINMFPEILDPNQNLHLSRCYMNTISKYNCIYSYLIATSGLKQSQNTELHQ